MTILNPVNFKKPQWKPMLAVLAALCFAAAGCGISDAKNAQGPEYGDSVHDWVESGAKPVDVPDGYELFEWNDLLAPGANGEDIYTRYEDRLAAVEIGSPESNALYEQMQAEAATEGEVVNTALDSKKIHMAGFVTPLNFEDEVITEFLFVPYFQACIHVPAPPPNQTVMVKLDEGEAMDIEDTWGAVWITGTLTATATDTDLATAGYTITQATSSVDEGY